ncbi:MAG: Gldg family protein [Proteobacteria bacterium]|nr:Gldg family protein [Pseudomonadota bacterium]MBU4297430.1 Gldg family protein [Pseudomonadota bacterium]MCG2746061.1 Gldg family protein [Desulfobulbaceae bacterium]
MKQILAICGKEMKTYFGTPMAAIFIGFFLLCSLFSFFWLETFFARNTADIRPLFNWMPMLMIFLAAALTMRQWSEEQKIGTLEVLLTLPVRLHQLVLGKFLAVLALTSCALLLTIGLPISVAMMGNMDWGPVIGGYLGGLLMAAAYISIGLFVSCRTDNQIISLMLTVLLAGLFFLIGSSGITDFFGNQAADFLRNLGTGSRFSSIERGVIDLRDVFYYLSLAVFFLTLNIYFLDRTRWSFGENTAGYRRKAAITVLLIAVNLLAANIWLSRVSSARLDLTAQREYSLSRATREIIINLPEPLVMRGYFSAKTHPLLSPLVPRIKDLMTEYGIASRGNIQVSFVDPKLDEQIETEANQQYGIKPIPFQVAGRYEASVVNSYFHILIKYGDQFVTLGFDDLIEVKPRPDGQLDVSLRNLEYDLTRSIKKVVYGFQSLATVFDGNPAGYKLISIITPRTLPEPFQAMPDTIKKVAGDLEQESGGKLLFEEKDPDGLSAAEQQKMNDQYGIEPIRISLFADDTFYLLLLLQTGDNIERLYLTPDMGEAELRQEIEGAIKRNGSGFTKTIGVWAPTAGQQSPLAMMGHGEPKDNYQIMEQLLRENYNLQKVDLGPGRIPGDIDVLLLLAPHDLTDVERLAVDQYLMQGGAVTVLAGNYLLDMSPEAQSLQVSKVKDGLAGLLSHYGITVGESLVMDKQNEPFPIPVSRNIGGMTIQEIQRIDYPFFVDVRPENMASDNPITASLPAVTMNWVSPLSLDDQKLQGKKVAILLKSSNESWLAPSPIIEPDFDHFPGNGFAPGQNLEQYNLAVAITGDFASFFQNSPDPRLQQNANKEKSGHDESMEEEHTEPEHTQKNRDLPPMPIINHSPPSARLVVIGSAEFVSDTVISMSQGLGADRFLNSLGFIQNVIDWSVADEDLLTIRSRGSHARLLKPMTRQEQTFWEWLNYGVALAALAAVSIFGANRRRKEKPMQLVEETP